MVIIIIVYHTPTKPVAANRNAEDQDRSLGKKLMGIVKCWLVFTGKYVGG